MLLIHLAIMAYLLILFGQTALDKCLDWQGNRGYVSSFFAQSPLKKYASLLLFFLLVFESITALSGLAAIVVTVLNYAGGSICCSEEMFVHTMLSGAWLSLLSVFFGQRMAKDYASAASTTSYLTFLLVSTWLMMMSCTAR